MTELSQSDTLKANELAQKTYQVQVKAYRALRAFYMGKAHAAFKRWKEAAALFETVKKLVSEFKNEKFTGELSQLLTNLDGNAEVELACAKASYVLEQVTFGIFVAQWFCLFNCTFRKKSLQHCRNDRKRIKIRSLSSIVWMNFVKIHNFLVRIPI